MIGIYKITNKITNKSYIGQSVRIERCWKEHQQLTSNSVISKAIRKYGVDNFNFEIIETCSKENLDDREIYWIQYYNTIVPNGYNVAEDKNNNYHTTYRFFDKEIFLQIINDIKNSDLSFREISQKYNVHPSTITRINKGEIHTLEEEKYPLRIKEEKKEFYCIDCGKKISYGATRCDICEKMRQRTVTRPDREELKNMIRTIPFTKIAEKYHVCDNSIRKWCDYYNLPRKKKDINKYSDEEWLKI